MDIHSVTPDSKVCSGRTIDNGSTSCEMKHDSRLQHPYRSPHDSYKVDIHTTSPGSKVYSGRTIDNDNTEYEPQSYNRFQEPYHPPPVQHSSSSDCHNPQSRSMCNPTNSSSSSCPCGRCPPDRNYYNHQSNYYNMPPLPPPQYRAPPRQIDSYTYYVAPMSLTGIGTPDTPVSRPGLIQVILRRKYGMVTLQWETFTGTIGANGRGYLTLNQDIANPPVFRFTTLIYVIYNNIGQLGLFEFNPFTSESLKIHFSIDMNFASNGVRIGDTVEIPGNAVTWITTQDY